MLVDCIKMCRHARRGFSKRSVRKASSLEEVCIRGVKGCTAVLGWEHCGWGWACKEAIVGKVTDAETASQWLNAHGSRDCITLRRRRCSLKDRNKV
jgi:hypothetical protein